MKTLLTEEALKSGVARMAREISAAYGDQPLTIVGVLTGSIVLMADLIRLLEMPLRVGVISASSYKGEVTRGDLTINSDLMLEVTHRHVLLIDDIFDTGHTLLGLVRRLQEYQPASVRCAVLLRKDGRRDVEYHPDFVGFDIPDEFVVGYGLDYRDEYRNLPFVAALEPHEIQRHPA